MGILIAALFLTPMLTLLPIAALAATIIVAVLSLVDLKKPVEVFCYSRADFAAMIATIAVTLLVGVEPGVIAGGGVILALFIWRASRPHAAIVGRVPGTEHFRSIKRHDVLTDPRVWRGGVQNAEVTKEARRPDLGGAPHACHIPA